ncbi:MAG: hypothetical protein SXA11_05670 [Cyanobacteriota bacterium]|nr:hypothetical protein [Cyanobacteriota bacterium]
MEDKLTEEQMRRLVGEVERLSQRRNEELNREQVEEILEELNLPTDLVDEAMMQLRRREALEAEEKRKKWIGAGALALAAAALVGGSVWFFGNQQALTGVYANSEQSVLTVESGGGREAIATVDRLENPQVSYRVTLQDAPVGQELSLGCDWINPQGQTAHQNRYETKTVDKEVWPTRCRYRFNNGSAVGTWEVRMFLGDRLLSKTQFLVK